MQSGISRSIAQSPPPITFPALVDAAPIKLPDSKNERRYAEKIISAAPFEAL